MTLEKGYPSLVVKANVVTTTPWFTPAGRRARRSPKDKLRLTF